MYKLWRGDKNCIPVEAVQGVWIDLAGHSEFEEDTDSDGGTETSEDIFQNSDFNTAEYNIKKSFYYYEDIKRREDEVMDEEDEVNYK